MTTVAEGSAFKELAERAAKDFKELTEQTAEWVSKYMNPEEVFPDGKLEDWARGAGFIHKDDAEDWAYNNGFVKEDDAKDYMLGAR